MIGYSVLDTVFQQLFQTVLVKKIYHDVFIYTEKDKRKPVYKHGNDYLPIGLDDRKSLYCYIRQNGEALNFRTEYAASSQKWYNMRVPYRFVFFNAHEQRNSDLLTTMILNIAFGQWVDLVKIINDVQALQAVEGNINDFELSAKAFYLALDISITLRITKDNCAKEIRCEDLPNPICQKLSL